MRTYSLSLTIEADDTSKISEVLGIQADPLPIRNAQHCRRHWRHFFVREADCDIEEEIGKALERCQPFQKEFLNWSESGAHMELFVGIFSNSNVSFSIGPQNVAIAAAIGFSIGFDYYP